MAITTLAELVEEASSRGVSVGAIVREREAEQSGRPEDDLDADMRERLGVMRSAVDRGLAGVRSRSGLTGGDGPRMASARMNGETICGEPFDSALAYALAVAEVNASMGRIVAAPTAGSCGVLPGVLLSVGERLCVDDLALVEALFASGGVGAVIERSSTLSGAAAGCQAECGSAAAMASAAAVQLAGGSPEACASAVAIALSATPWRDWLKCLASSGTRHQLRLPSLPRTWLLPESEALFQQTRS
jgi:L-serine dehydratase